MPGAPEQGTIVELRAGRYCFVLYRVSDPRWASLPNVYREVLSPEGVGKRIGHAFVTGRWCWSFVWDRL